MSEIIKMELCSNPKCMKPFPLPAIPTGMPQPKRVFCSSECFEAVNGPAWFTHFQEGGSSLQ